MRGSHPGSFAAAHTVRDFNFWEKSGKPIDTHEEYGLIVVGGGMSGLAGDYFYRKQPERLHAFSFSITRTISADTHNEMNFARLQGARRGNPTGRETITFTFPTAMPRLLACW
jgi:hypothetical protein